ncbi:MAG: diaminopimelate decarboxylase [Alphaproteobacteria bacterium]|nr:diaminopimelate decarboxylase [Alphaproteobacteria bacterium]
MDHFRYRDGELYAEDVPLSRLARRHGTPFYCYSSATLERHYRVFAEALKGLDATICFAVKANSNIGVLATLARLGAGADVVSGGELARAIAAGVPPSRIVFSGVGKSREEMAAALRAGVMQINVESEPELIALDQVARSTGRRATASLRINPDVDARTHHKITTGRSENKFGVEWTQAHRLYHLSKTLPGVRMIGIAIHIGSQILDLTPFRDAFVRARDLVSMLRSDGHIIERIDLGGGLGIPYDGRATSAPSPAEYGALVKEVFGGFDGRLIFEPGRVLVGNAGVLVARVLYVKEGATRTFVVVDAAMNDLIRPALYDAFHAIWPVAEPPAGVNTREVDVVGPICETGDTFATGRALPPLKEGDLVVFRTAGAYGAVMSSAYNTRPPAAEVLVKGAQAETVKRRRSTAALFADESVPAWLGRPRKGGTEKNGTKKPAKNREKKTAKKTMARGRTKKSAPRRRRTR